MNVLCKISDKNRPYLFFIFVAFLLLTIFSIGFIYANEVLADPSQVDQDIKILPIELSRDNGFVNIKVPRPELVTPPPLQGNQRAISNGIYGPFSSYYFPSLSTSNALCHLVRSDFVVICLPAKTTIGQLLAETDKTGTIHAQLFAVNNALNDRAMPEFVVNFPLANKDQMFFAKDIVKRLFRGNSIFDEPCKFSYQIDGQLQKNEEWICSSFLQRFDKYTGQPGLYYELHIRPIALRSASEQNKAYGAKQGWFDFFKSIQNGTSSNNTVILSNGELTVDFTLDLTGYARWINRLVDVYYSDEPTIDTSDYDEIVGKISAMYPTNDNTEPQNAVDDIAAGEEIYGPFDPRICKVKRYIEYTNNTNSQKLYQDMFLIDCNHLKIYEEKVPEWSMQVFIPEDREAFASSSNSEDAINVTINLQKLAAPSFISINDAILYVNAYTFLNYQLSKMPQDFFNSQVLHDTLRSPGQIECPCTVSYTADGKQLSKEALKCNLSYKISDDGINFEINVDYGFQNCMRRGDKSCRKEALTKAASFLKEIGQNTREVSMAIEFEGGEAISADLNLTELDLTAVDRLFKRIDSFD